MNGILFKVQDNLINQDCRVIYEKKSFLWSDFNKTWKFNFRNAYMKQVNLNRRIQEIALL